MARRPRPATDESTPPRRVARLATAILVAALLCASSGASAAVNGEPGSSAADATVPPTHSEPRQSPGWWVTGGSSEVGLGDVVANVGDVNGDGYDDLVVGAPLFSDTEQYRGKALLYLGSAGGLDTAASWEAVGAGTFSFFGSSVGSAGDINGDGKADVIVGEPFYTEGTDYYFGRALVYYGTASGLSAAPAWTTKGLEGDSRFGGVVAGGFDLNGDTYDDVLVAAPAQNHGGDDSVGCVHLYFGAAPGLAAAPGWTVCGEAEYVWFGDAAAGIGDVNDDGRPDFAVGSPGFSGGEDREGKLYVYHGVASGAPSTVAAATVEGNEADAYFASAVAGAGDVNGDGYDDLLVGAPNHTAVLPEDGRAFVLPGSATGIASTPLWTADGGSYSGFGRAVASALDVNNDGYGDVLVAGSAESGIRPQEGVVTVFHGTADGVGSEPAWSVSGTQSWAWFGESVTAGDFNGDSKVDVVVGAPSRSEDFDREGAAFAYMGGDQPGRHLVVDSSADDGLASDALPGDGTCADAQGRCTMRAALQEARQIAGPDLITFSQPFTITVSAAAGQMPVITDPVTIDASSVWNAAGQRPGVVLDGAGLDDDGLHIMGDGVTVMGLTVTGFGQKGVVVDGIDNVIGGPASGQETVVSGNGGSGVVLWGPDTHHNLVQSSYIGVAPGGQAALPNRTGVWIAFGASHNVVGGEDLERGNVISGNTVNGVSVESDGSDYNTLLRNTIGMAPDGLAPMPNARGVLIGAGPHGTSVGWVTEIPPEEALAPVSTYPAALRGAAARDLPDRTALLSIQHAALAPRHGGALDLDEPNDGDANLIAGNSGAGVQVLSTGGFVGVIGNTVRGNGAPGIGINGRSHCLVEANVIRGNAGAGVEVSGAGVRYVELRGNTVWDNSGKGVALLDGANGGLAAPSILAADTAGASGTSCAECDVEIFSDVFDEGERFEGSTQADAVGSWTFAGPLRGPNITAINTTIEGESSEFASPLAIATPPTPTSSATADPTPTSSATADPTPTSTPTPTDAATVMASATASATDHAATSPTVTATAIGTAAPSATPSPLSTVATPSASPAATSEATPSPTPDRTATVTRTAAPTATPTPSESPGSVTPTPTPALQFLSYMPLALAKGQAAVAGAASAQAPRREVNGD
ncbi:MAG: FG-GAP-like repeat-containing protein [Anaerolineae bacterium]